MLISKDMVVKGCFSQPKIFKIIFYFLGQKIPFKNIYHALEDFSKFNRPFKSTVALSQSSIMEPTKNKEAALGAVKSVVYTENNQKKHPPLNNRFF